MIVQKDLLNVVVMQEMIMNTQKKVQCMTPLCLSQREV